ncbi:MAG: transposase [Verrucomicrobia bacterium]|nr:transposase [Verrucomicrobiota bacterium]
MPRSVRIEYPGAIYHVLNRGDRREDIFRDDSDHQRFLATLEEACLKTGWQVHAYCLMRNHFHLVLETPQPNLVAGMKWFLGVYTRRFNLRHKVCGHLFAGRYKALVVDGSENAYLRTVCDYVHLNPERAKLLTPTDPLESFRWSSYPLYLKPPQERPAWLRVDRLLGEKGIPRDTAAGRYEFSQRMEQRRAEENTADYRELRRGWFVGREEFRQELLDAAGKHLGSNNYGSERRETDQQKAERIVQERLASLHWQESDLATRAKSDPVKVELARRLRRETTMSLKWIAQRVHMGTWTNVSNLLPEKPAEG